MNATFRDRQAAGQVLGEQLRSYSTKADLLVLGLPRGGVPVAYEIATALGAPLDVFVVRKLGVPGQEELAMGAIAAGGVRVLDWTTISALGITNATIDDVAGREARELLRRERQYRGQLPPRRMTGRTVMLVDDGLATGSSMRAAIGAVRAYQPGKIVVAIPVAPADVCEQLRTLVDDLVCMMTPGTFLRSRTVVRRFFTGIRQRRASAARPSRRDQGTREPRLALRLRQKRPAPPDRSRRCPPNPTIAVGVLGEVLLVVILRIVEGGSFGDLGGDGPVALFGEPLLVDIARSQRGLLLLVAVGVDAGAVLGAHVVALTHSLRRIVVLPEYPQQIRVRDSIRIEDDLDDLGVPGHPRADLPVRGILGVVAARIAHR